jgi:hypothetical protein
VDSRNHRREKFRVATGLRCVLKLVPKAQPDISQTQSVWYRGKGKPVLKGRWKHLNDDCLLEIPLSFQDESICASNPDTACLANFRRRSATPNAVALHYMYYNFCRIHQTLRVTPAMEAGIANHVWALEEIVGLLP